MDRRKKLVVFVLALFAMPLLMGAIVLNTSEKKFSNVAASDLDVPSLTSEYSTILSIGGCRALGIWIRATSAGTPNVVVTIEYSPTKDAANFGQLEGGSTVITLTDTAPHNDFLIMKGSNYMRFKFQGAGANPADTFIDCVVNKVYGQK
jgi:hypothetical protein